MAAERIDVLGVMDDRANAIETKWPKAYADGLREARAAVAELVAADKDYDAALDAYHDAQMGGIGSSLYQLSEGDPTVIRLREASSRRAAAIARMGEGA